VYAQLLNNKVGPYQKSHIKQALPISLVTIQLDVVRLQLEEEFMIVHQQKGGIR